MIKEIVIVASVILTLFSAGCINSQEKESKYVKLQMMDGTEVGGKYVSESPAFVTINPMYILDENGFMTKGNEKEVGIKTNIVASMVKIDNPTEMISTTLKAQEDKAAKIAAAQRIEQEKRDVEIQEEIEARNADLKNRMPTKKAKN